MAIYYHDDIPQARTRATFTFFIRIYLNNFCQESNDNPSPINFLPIEFRKIHISLVAFVHFVSDFSKDGNVMKLKVFGVSLKVLLLFSFRFGTSGSQNNSELIASGYQLSKR